METLIAFISGFVTAIFVAYNLGRSGSDDAEDEQSTVKSAIPKVLVEQVDTQYLAFDKTTNQFLAQHTDLSELIMQLTSDGDILVSFESKELEDYFITNFGK